MSLSHKEGQFAPPKYLTHNQNEINDKLLRQYQCDLTDVEKMKDLANQHIDSFNYAMTSVLKILPKYTIKRKL